MARVNTRPRLHPKFLQGDAALDGAAEFILKGLVAGSLLRPYVGDSVEQVKAELKTFLSTSFEGVFPGIRIGPSAFLSASFKDKGRDLVTERALVGFEEAVYVLDPRSERQVLVKVIKEHQLEEDALVQARKYVQLRCPSWRLEAVQFLSKYGEDVRIIVGKPGQVISYHRISLYIYI